MSAQEVEEGVTTSRGLGASLVSVIVMLVVVLGITAYWWRVARVATCTENHLKLSLGQPSGVAGITETDIELTNNGTQRCKLSSSAPAVTLTNSNGLQLGDKAAARSMTAGQPLTIAHHDTVHAVLNFPNAQNFQPGECSSASNYIKVIPAGLTAGLEVPFAQYSCPGFSVTVLKAGT